MLSLQEPEDNSHLAGNKAAYADNSLTPVNWRTGRLPQYTQMMLVEDNTEAVTDEEMELNLNEQLH